VGQLFSESLNEEIYIEEIYIDELPFIFFILLCAFIDGVFKRAS
jgi:hypothetical protein